MLLVQLVSDIAGRNASNYKLELKRILNLIRRKNKCSFHQKTCERDHTKREGHEEDILRRVSLGYTHNPHNRKNKCQNQASLPKTVLHQCKGLNQLHSHGYTRLRVYYQNPTQNILSTL